MPDAGNSATRLEQAQERLHQKVREAAAVATLGCYSRVDNHRVDRQKTQKGHDEQDSPGQAYILGRDNTTKQITTGTDRSVA